METDRIGAVYERLSVLSRRELIEIYKVFNNWGWPKILGEPPIRNWDSLPEYRRTWMPESAVTRYDFIAPYMAAIIALGVTHEDAYGGTTSSRILP